MNERIEITRRVAIGATRLAARVYNTFYGRSSMDEVYEYTLRYDDNCCRVVEDFYMQEMRLRTTPAEYNEYVTRRLTDTMLKHIGDGIKQAVRQQADKNAPKSDNMAYLFGDK